MSCYPGSVVCLQMFNSLEPICCDFSFNQSTTPEKYEHKMVEPIFDYQFRLILIGDSTVGKSSLLKYFTDGKFSDLCDPTVGVDFFARLIEVKNGIRVKLQLWDTAGQERFRFVQITQFIRKSLDACHCCQRWPN